MVSDLGKCSLSNTTSDRAPYGTANTSPKAKPYEAAKRSTDNCANDRTGKHANVTVI
jgi:hypothetical protein